MMKLIIILINLFLFLNGQTIVTKKINMGNNHFVYINEDLEWNTRGTLLFTYDLNCYTVSSDDIKCLDSNYENHGDLLPLKNILFKDINMMNNQKKSLHAQRLENYFSIYSNYDFETSNYQVLFSYLFLINNNYTDNIKFNINKFNKVFNINYLNLENKHNLVQYNNMAYYLQKAGANKEALFLLEKIIEKYPSRTVAYINIADAYWGDDNKKEAIKSYKIYIKQMKAKGKEKRIPKYVLDRVNTFL